MKELHQILKLTNRGEKTVKINSYTWQVFIHPYEIKVLCSKLRFNKDVTMNWRFRMWQGELIYTDGFNKKEFTRLAKICNLSGYNGNSSNKHKLNGVKN